VLGRERVSSAKGTDVEAKLDYFASCDAASDVVLGVVASALLHPAIRNKILLMSGSGYFAMHMT
jgi:hypothetical protein